MTGHVFGLLQSAEFAVRTREDGSELAHLLSRFLTDSTITGVCLSELVVNAVEHGNLGIGGELKCELLRTGRYEQELTARYLAYQARRVHITVRRCEPMLEVKIADEGAGFPWRDYLAAEIEPCTKPNGRGIALVMHRFPDLEYIGAGNVVVLRAELRA